MGYFDFLINNNKEAEKGVEYIYNHSMAWKPNEGFTSFDVKKGSIVINVVKQENNSFEFEFKDNPGEIYRTNYGWSFVKKSEENKSLIMRIRLQEEKLKVLRERLKEQTLDGPSNL